MGHSYQDRIDLVRNAVKKEPEDRDAHVEILMALIERQQPQRIVDEFKGIVDLIPFSTQLHYDILGSLANRGYASLLERVFRTTHPKAPQDFRISYGLGLVLQTMNRHDEAISVYKQALDLKPKFAPLHHNIAVAYLAKNLPEKAEEAAKQAILCISSFAEPTFLLGTLCFDDGRFFQAEMWFHSLLLYASPYLEPFRKQADANLALIGSLTTQARKDFGRERRSKQSFLYRICNRVHQIFSGRTTGRPTEFAPSMEGPPSLHKAVPFEADSSYYRTILLRFRQGLAKLSVENAYGGLREIVSALTLADFTATPLENVRWGTRFPRTRKAVAQLAAANDAFRRREFDGVKRIAQRIINDSENAIDPSSLVDAEHLLGRVQFEEQHFHEAEKSFLRLMSLAQGCRYDEGFVRALHEMSRVKAKWDEVIDAEAGFRVALDYYSFRAINRNAERDQISADDPDLKNMQVAINCLSGIAETYFLLSRGPMEAVALIDGLGSDLFSSRDASGYEFFEIRGLALKLLTRREKVPHAANLVAKAMKLYAEHTALSIYGLAEAEWVCAQSGLTYPSILRSILEQPKPFPLSDAPSFKSNVPCLAGKQTGLRHISTADPAESVEKLHEYLATLDTKGRYVYRGQVREYEGPLLPSAFRPILRQPYGLTTLPSAFEIRESLRQCGETYAGEYNYCFAQYADVMKKARDDGMDDTEIERIFSVYKRLLEDPFIAFEQDQEGFVPWQTAVERRLSAAELDIYGRYGADWNLRIDNYHKRLFRDNVLVRLFGYTLGTTFAQQYGLSSEGLDATKSLPVACFFASHDSKDFLKVVGDGVGIVYRFPFPTNDIAMRPLSSFNYYNLPSIIDVEDVFYRFEHHRLQKADSLSCMLCYLTSALTYNLQSSDLMMLPEDFLRSSRVNSQQAVIIIPDEKREDEPNRSPGPDGITFPKYRYIEDLGARPGVDRFYFKHKGSWPEQLSSVKREHLWPRDDFLLQALILLIAASYRMSQAIPKRLDLIDGGYSPADFLSYCQELYKRHRYQFFTGYESIAKSFGTLIL